MAGLFKDEIDILYTASNKLTQASTPVEQLEAVSDYAHTCGAGIGVLFHMDAEAELEVAAEWTTGKAVPLITGTRYAIAALNFSSVWLARPGRPTLIYDTAADDRIDPETRAFFERHRIRGVAILPLNNKGRWIGALMFGWYDPYLFDERDLRIFTTLQQQAAPVIDSVRLFEQTQKRALELEIAKNEMDILYEASSKLTRASTPLELLEAVSDYPRERGATSALLLYFDSTADKFPSRAEVVAEWTSNHAIPWGTGRIFSAADYETEFWLKRPDQPVFIADAIHDERLNDRMRQLSIEFNLASFLFLPLNNRGRWVGLMVFHWNQPYHFTERDYRIFQSLIQQTSPVIDSLQLIEENRKRAIRAEYLVRVNTALSQATGELEILEAVALYAGLHSPYGMILNYVDYDEDSDTAVSYVVAVYKDGKAAYFDHQQNTTVRLYDYGIHELWIHQPDRVLFIENIASDERISPDNREALQEKMVSRSLALMPLYSGRGYKGILTIFWDQPHTFSDEEKYIYTALMQPIAAIIAGRRAYLAEEEARQESEFLYHMSEAINAATTFDEILQAVAHLDPHAHSITLTAWEGYDYDSASYLEVIATIHRGEGTVMSVGQRYSKGNFPIADWMTHNGVWVIEDIQTDSRVDPVTATTWRFIGTRAMIGTTLNIHNRWIGGLTFRSRTPRTYTARDIRLMSSIKELAVAAFERIRLQAETEASRRQAETLAQVNAALSLAKDEQEILGAVSAMAEYYGVAISSLLYARGENHDSAEVEMVAIRSSQDGAVPLSSTNLYKVDDYPLFRAAYHNPEEPVFVENIFTDPRIDIATARHLPEVQEWPSVIGIPLKAGNQWLGLLSFIWTEPQTFSQEMRLLFKAVQPTVSAVVATRRAYLAERQRAHELETVAKVSAAVSSILDVQELLDTVVKLGRINFDQYHMFIYLLDEEEKYLVQATGVRQKPLRIALNCTTSLVAQAACTRKGMMVNDVTSAPDYELTPMLPNARSEMAVPMVVGEKLIGVLSIQSRETNHFAESDIWVMATLADLTAVAVQNARLYSQAQELAILEERNRLARELHDSVSQALYGIALGARTARTLLERNPAKLHEPLDYVLALAEGGLTEMRALIFELRPESLENEGLITALSKQAAALQVRHGIKVEVDLCNEPDIPLEVKDTLYRIAREALHNTVKHAQASHVVLRIKRTSSTVDLEVSDNGLGFEVKDSFPGHLGLQSMRERTLRVNGTIEVKSAPGEGTSIRVSIPIDKTRTLTMSPLKV